MPSASIWAFGYCRSRTSMRRSLPSHCSPPAIPCVPFVATRWPGAIWHREVPVSAATASEHGLRRIEGTIDLLLQTPAGFVIIDHKSFPGNAALWAAKALEYAPQLLTYAMTIAMSGGLVIGQFIHFTVGGGMVEVATT